MVRGSARSTLYSLSPRTLTAPLPKRRWFVLTSSRTSRRKHRMKCRPIRTLSKQPTLNLLTDSLRLLICVNSPSVRPIEMISLFDTLVKARSVITGQDGRLADKTIPLTTYLPEKLSIPCHASHRCPLERWYRLCHNWAAKSTLPTWPNCYRKLTPTEIVMPILLTGLSGDVAGH